MWHVDYGEGGTEDHTSREEAEAAATRSHRPKSATWSSRNNELVHRSGVLLVA